MTRIGFIAALEYEVKALKSALHNIEESNIAGTTYYLGTIGNYEVVIMLCGMGKVSAALGTQAMISEYHPDFIINTGCAGALAKDLKIGDIVISTKAVEWDLDTIKLGNPRGYISSLNCVYLDADNKIGDIISAYIPEDVNVTMGLIVSGDQFVSSDIQKNTILDSFPKALCAEMEGAAIAHVCTQNNVPFCIIRSMSDTADGDSDVDFAEFSAIAGEKSANVLLKMLYNE